MQSQQLSKMAETGAVLSQTSPKATISKNREAGVSLYIRMFEQILAAKKHTSWPEEWDLGSCLI